MDLNYKLDALKGLVEKDNKKALETLREVVKCISFDSKLMKDLSKQLAKDIRWDYGQLGAIVNYVFQCGDGLLPLVGAATP